MNNNAQNEMMQKFNQLSLQYKKYSKELNKKNKEKKIKNPQKNVIHSISSITYNIKKSENTINELKKEYEVYNNFNNLCKKFINLSNERKELIDKIQNNFVFSTLKLDSSLLNKEDETLLFIQNIYLKSNNKSYDIDYKIGQKQDKINNFKKLINLCIEDKYKDIFLCQICFSNKINTCINPCGHTFCGECAEKMSECTNCKSFICGKIKMSINHDDNDATNVEGYNGSTLSTSLLDNKKTNNIKSKEYSSFDPMSSIGFSTF